jgi:CRISPR system Cascade subunit CasD
MTAVLLMPLVGPMQSWGTRSRFQERDTEREPSKSGVVGLLCAALGRDRSEPVNDLADLRMGVRTDKEGRLCPDFQTTQKVIVASGGSWEDQISHRFFLADAAFLVGLEGDEGLLTRLHAALLNPVWPLFLGRKSYVPSVPLYLSDGLWANTGLRAALLGYPLLSVAEREEKIRLVLESAIPTHESRMDTPVSFSIGRRVFRERFVTTEFVSVGAFPRREDDNVSIANSV